MTSLVEEAWGHRKKDISLSPAFTIENYDNTILGKDNRNRGRSFSVISANLLSSTFAADSTQRPGAQPLLSWNDTVNAFQQRDAMSQRLSVMSDIPVLEPMELPSPDDVSAQHETRRSKQSAGHSLPTTLRRNSRTRHQWNPRKWWKKFCRKISGRRPNSGSNSRHEHDSHRYGTNAMNELAEANQAKSESINANPMDASNHCSNTVGIQAQPQQKGRKKKRAAPSAPQAEIYDKDTQDTKIATVKSPQKKTSTEQNVRTGISATMYTPDTESNNISKARKNKILLDIADMEFSPAVASPSFTQPELSESLLPLLPLDSPDRSNTEDLQQDSTKTTMSQDKAKENVKARISPGPSQTDADDSRDMEVSASPEAEAETKTTVLPTPKQQESGLEFATPASEFPPTPPETPPDCPGDDCPVTELYESLADTGPVLIGIRSLESADRKVIGECSPAAVTSIPTPPSFGFQASKPHVTTVGNPERQTLRSQFEEELATVAQSWSEGYALKRQSQLGSPVSPVRSDISNPASMSSPEDQMRQFLRFRKHLTDTVAREGRVEERGDTQPFAGASLQGPMIRAGSTDSVFLSSSGCVNCYTVMQFLKGVQTGDDSAGHANLSRRHSGFHDMISGPGTDKTSSQHQTHWIKNKAKQRPSCNSCSRNHLASGKGFAEELKKEYDTRRSNRRAFSIKMRPFSVGAKKPQAHPMESPGGINGKASTEDLSTGVVLLKNLHKVEHQSRESVTVMPTDLLDAAAPNHWVPDDDLSDSEMIERPDCRKEDEDTKKKLNSLSPFLPRSFTSRRNTLRKAVMEKTEEGWEIFPWTSPPQNISPQYGRSTIYYAERDQNNLATSSNKPSESRGQPPAILVEPPGVDAIQYGHVLPASKSVQTSIPRHMRDIENEREKAEATEAVFKLVQNLHQAYKCCEDSNHNGVGENPEGAVWKMIGRNTLAPANLYSTVRSSGSCHSGWSDISHRSSGPGDFIKPAGKEKVD